jgi:hypothetical protein
MAGASATQAAEMAASGKVKSPETYIGYARASGFVSPGGEARDQAKDYAIPAQLTLNQWALGGRWSVAPQVATEVSAGGKIAFRFHARDLHLVLGPAAGKPVRFKVTIDGHAPGADAGGDVKPDGTGVVTAERLYQLVRLKGDVTDRTFQIEFLDPGVRAFSFTFG